MPDKTIEILETIFRNLAGRDAWFEAFRIKQQSYKLRFLNRFLKTQIKHKELTLYD